MRRREAGFWPLKPIRPLRLVLGIVLLSVSGWVLAEHLINEGSVRVALVVFGGIAFEGGLVVVAEAIWLR